jgi:hypothetical protein
MNFSEDVFELSESFMNDPKYVFINESEIEYLANDMKVVGKPTFRPPEVDDEFKGVLIELVAASVNYCYWYGKHDIRPCNSSSTTMYEDLVKSFEYYKVGNTFEESINAFIQNLSIGRFPLLEERERHLRQLIKFGETFVKIVCDNHERIEPSMDILLSYFTGFASDMFLKRASLFFIQLFRRYGWFEKDLHSLHVPADYQVPKMLNHFGCIIYEDDLSYAIDTNQLIPKHSQAECEIRAATVLTIKMLCEITGWNVAEVDAFFFTRRHDAQNPFHLTITTDY